MKIGIFVSGTDTDVGKTFVSSLLVSSLHSYGIKTGYFKPVQTGTDSDTQTVIRLTGVSNRNFPDPVYSFPEPMSPNRAAQLHHEEIQLDRIIDAWEKLDERAWVVEGAGGLMVPLNGKLMIRDLVQALKIKLLIVSSTRLGTINHTLLTVEAAKSAGIPIAGIVLNGPEDPGLIQVFEDIARVPVIVQVPRYTSVTEILIREQGVNLFSASKLRGLYD